MPSIQEVISIDRYSNYGRIFRIAAYVLCLNEHCRSKDSRKVDELTAAEISKAEKIFILQAKATFEGQYLDKITRQLGVFKDKDGCLDARED